MTWFKNLKTENIPIPFPYSNHPFLFRLPLSFFVGLRPVQPIWTTAELWDVGQGVTLVLGEVDVTRVNPY